MRDIEFRAWAKPQVGNGGVMLTSISKMGFDHTGKIGIIYGYRDSDFRDLIFSYDFEIMQFTGLTDKNGVKIFEHMELDGLFEVEYLNGSYVLINISNGDIIELYKYVENKHEQVTITKEYTKI